MMRVVITGASKGIGAAIARKLASQGCELILCSRNIHDLEHLKAEINGQYPDSKVHVLSVDLSKKNAVEDFGNFIIHAFDAIDILVNNAGIYFPGSLLNEPDENLENLMKVNLYSAYHLTRIIAPGMVARKKGHIINMCSVASMNAYANGGSYSITKYALLGFSKNLREELKHTGVRVTSILPGATWSDSWKGVDLPADRLMNADDIAQVVSTAIHLSASAVIEDIVIRPAEGDL